MWLVLASLLLLPNEANAGLFGRPSATLTPEQQEAELARLEAEHVRLSEDIEQLASRQLWPGVERRFEELGRRGIVPSRQDYVHAAMAARAQGDLLAAYDRLKAAARIEPTRDVLELIAAIDRSYGMVELIAHNPKDTTLEAGEMPFDPDMRASVQTAADEVHRTGMFTGLLPKGAYTFAGQSFDVEPGLSVRIEVSPRLKKTNGERVEVTTMPVTPR